MSELPGIRARRQTIRKIERGMEYARQRAQSVTREMVTADAVRAPERASMARYAAEADAAARAVAGLRAECEQMERRERLRLEASNMSARRVEFLWRYYVGCERKRELMTDLGVTRWTVRRWIAAEEGRAKKG